MASDQTKQLHIIHLTDLHFGEDHRFMAPSPVSGASVIRPGFPSLLSKLRQDFEDPKPIDNLIICLTGDFATNPANKIEFERAEQFVRELSQLEIHGRVRGLNNIFMVPGNHDVEYGKPTLGQRWERYSGFLSRIRSVYVDHDKPLDMVEMHRRDDLGAIILCLNSEIYVQDDKDNRYRGEIDQEQLEKVDKLLNDVPDEYVKVALIHHHPILIPELTEPNRNYDAVLNSGSLLRILREKGFHAILHGHKHNPFVFSEDSQSAWTGTTRQPIVIVAGGSIGSKGTPDAFLYRGNCYNRITIKWHPAARQSRVYVETRGLDVFSEDGDENLPHRWKWEKLRHYDMPFFAQECKPEASRSPAVVLDSVEGKSMNDARSSEYVRLRGNMLVVEVLPSLIVGQAYEARVWVVPHTGSLRRELPVEVVWNAGPQFANAKITHAQSKWFAASFQYWGAMLIQARLKFADGAMEDSFIYARLPEDCS